MWLTLTLDSYGPVRADGTPVDPDTYDYRRAAWDAVHFPRLLDRFWQNLRRARRLERPVRRLRRAATPPRPARPLRHPRHHPPRHAAQVAAATYHQVWWPPADAARLHRSTGLRSGTPDRTTWVDPDTGEPLPTWDDALDALDDDPDAEPVHVVRFGAQVDAKGVTRRHRGRRTDHRLHHQVHHQARRRLPPRRPPTGNARTSTGSGTNSASPRAPSGAPTGCSTASNPRRRTRKLRPGHCKGKVHQRATLGIGGRRVLVSRDWSGKTLADHRADARAWVKALLGVTADADHRRPGRPRSRHTRPGRLGARPPRRPRRRHPSSTDSCAPSPQRIQWRGQLAAAQDGAGATRPMFRQPPRLRREQHEDSAQSNRCGRSKDVSDLPRRPGEHALSMAVPPDRSTGVRVGRHLRYDPADVRAWLAKQAV